MLRADAKSAELFPPDINVERLLSGKRVLVIGDVMLDAYLIGDAERISPEAPVPVVRVESERHLLGGAGNVARNIAALGGKATLIGTVGEDSAASRIHHLVEQEKITSALVALPQRPSTVKTRIMARRQQMLRLDQEVAAPLDASELDRLFASVETHITGHDVVILSDYSKGIISEAFMGRLKALAHQHENLRILVDPKPENTSLYTGTFIMTPNTKEAGECAHLPVRNQREILSAGEAILSKLDCKQLLITLGAEGMLLFEREHGVLHIPTTAQGVFDVTGAGDTVIATLALGLAAGMSLLEACTLSNYAAGLVVAQVGAATATPAMLAEAIMQLPPPQITQWA